MLVTLLTANNVLKLGINGDGALHFYVEFSHALGNPVVVTGKHQIQINPLFIKDAERHSALGKLCTAYASKDLWKLYSAIGEIGTKRHFFLIPSATDLGEQQKLDLQFELISMDGNQTVEELKKSFDDYSKCILQHYEIVASHNASCSLTKIGHKEYSQRVCRFCGRTESDGVTFRKKAHAISELIGNKSLILCDECDDCNGGIVNKMENSVATYFKALRPLLGIHGKSGIPSYKKNELEIGQMSPGHVNVMVGQQNLKVTHLEDGGLKMNVKVDCGKYVPQHIYRLICKYALSVLPDHEFDMSTFEDLRNWILTGTQRGCPLPLVAASVDGRQNPQFPQISVYKRRDQGCLKFPLYLVDFYAVANRFMFELPFMEQDHKLTRQESWKDLFATIPSFGRFEDWSYDDFGSAGEITLENNIVFEAKSRKQDVDHTVNSREF